MYSTEGTSTRYFVLEEDSSGTSRYNLYVYWYIQYYFVSISTGTTYTCTVQKVQVPGVSISTNHE